MNETRAFGPAYKASASGQQGTLLPSTTLAATDASQATAQFAGNKDNNGIVQIQIANLSTSWAYVNFGAFGNVAAATVAASYPVPPASVVVVSVHPEVSGATVILGTAAATGNVIFTRGSGV